MYHADFVTGQPIGDGDKVVAFLLERRVHRQADAMPLNPSHIFCVASLPLPGIFREGGELEAADGFEADYTRTGLQQRFASTAVNLMELAKGKLPLAFMRISTFNLLLEMVKRQDVFECLDDALALHARMVQWMASAEAAKFLELRVELEADSLAYMKLFWEARSTKDLEDHPVTLRLNAGKQVLGPGVYDRFHAIYQVLHYLNGPGQVVDPFTGESFRVPAPWYAFSLDYAERCLSSLVSEAVSTVADTATLLLPLLQIMRIDAALTMLGRFWSPSMYLGDWQCDGARTFYLEKLSEQELHID